MKKPEIIHQEDKKQFCINLADGQKAVIKYRLIKSMAGQREVDFYSTFVPDTHRGEGLAAVLVNAAFEWADSEGLAIKASCWYAAKKMAERT